jgi:hypothetical protein
MHELRGGGVVTGRKFRYFTNDDCMKDDRQHGQGFASKIVTVDAAGNKLR